MWKKNLGITCTLKVEEWGVYLDDRTNLNFDVTRSGESADYMDPMAFLHLWQTHEGNNFTGYGNKSYDALVAKGMATVDAKARMALLHAAEKIVMKDLPIFPVYFTTNPVLLSKHIKNFSDSPLGGIIDWKNAYMG